MENNKKILILGEHTLNESLSQSLYHDISEWYFDDFGEEITFERCQRILNQLGFKLSWSVLGKNITGVEGTFFSVGIESEEVAKLLFKFIPSISFDLAVLSSANPSENDSYLKSLIESDNKN